MNGYSLSRKYFDWAFEHPQDNNPTMTALYLFIVEINNRLGWKKEFTITPRECFDAIGINSYNTYKKNFDKLVELGFISLIRPSKNQYQANIISLLTKKNTNKALDTAIKNTFYASSIIENANENALIIHKQSVANTTCDIHKTSKNKQQTIIDIDTQPILAEKAEEENNLPYAGFIPPSIKEVTDYCKERKNTIDPQKFINHYQTVGWIVGSGQKEMKDWKAAIRTWESRDLEKKLNSKHSSQPEKLKNIQEQTIKSRNTAKKIKEEIQASMAEKIKSEFPQLNTKEFIELWTASWKKEYCLTCQQLGINKTTYTEYL